MAKSVYSWGKSVKGAGQKTSVGGKPASAKPAKSAVRKTKKLKTTRK